MVKNSYYNNRNGGKLMDNFKQFRALVDEYLKTDETYKIQIEIFMKYLEDNNLQKQVFN